MVLGRWQVQLLALALVLYYLHITTAWRTDRRPKIFGSKIKMKALSPRRFKIRKKIVHFHNFFRTRVQPPATNMLKMSWSRPAAKAAQRWAESCQLLIHDSEKGRSVDGFGPCGQNIFVGTKKVPWFFGVKTWWLEKDNFTYGSTNNDLFVVGHYTQMVWHSTHQVGCGIAYCDSKPMPYYNYVCNYCPIGNFMHTLGKPYKKGRPCSSCRRHCKAKKLCTNSCPYGDLWMNCRELAKFSTKWLCNTKTQQGYERLKNCQATCKCKGKITFP